MRSTIDKAGRLVIPKALRDQLGLTGAVELLADGAALRVEAVAGDDLAEKDGRLIIPPSGTHVDDDTVSALRDADQE